MMKKYLVTFFLFLFLLVPTINAVKPDQTLDVVADRTIVIRIPFIETVPLGEDINFQFHLFDSTDGTPITEGVNCTYHLYDDVGNHIWTHNYSVFSHIYDIKVMINSNNFSETGLYSYIFQCHMYQEEQGTTQSLGGEISSEFFITDNDYVAQNNDGTSGIVVLLFLGGINIFLFWMGFTQSFSDHPVTDFLIKRGTLVIAIFMLMYTSTIVSVIAKWGGLGITTELLRFSVWVGWIGYFAVLLLVLGSLFKLMEDWKRQARNKRMGEE